MASERAIKKRRLGEYFLDLEAGVDKEGEQSNDSIEAEDGSFLQDDDEQENDLPEVYMHTKLQSEYNRVALDVDYWQGMINRAHLRSLGSRAARVSQEEDREIGKQENGPRPEDKLWEVGCQVGKEEVAVFHLMQKAVLHNDSFTCLSAFAHHAVPGRIFVEADTSQHVITAASGIPELIPKKMRLVPDEKMTEVLSMTSSPRPKAQGWVRLLGNTKKLRRYKGDLALVVDVSNNSLLQLWLIPRIQYDDDDADSRPAPQLFNARGVKLSLVDQCIRETGRGSSVIFQKNEFTSQGYLVLSNQELHICEEGEALPTPQELDGFSGCEALLPSTLIEARRRIESSKVGIDDRVKVLRGPFRGLLGKVTGLADEEADVYLPSQDLNERVRICELAREFRVGDRVRAMAGNDETIGWVTKISNSHLSLFDSAKWSEVAVSALQTEFYEDERVIPLRCAPTLDINLKAMKENPYKRLIGKRVMVVRQNNYKGITGIVQDVTLAGEASVFLDIFNERSPRKFKISNICLVCQNSLVAIASGEVRQLPKVIDETVSVPSASTPMPTEEEISHDADAWDACAPDHDLSPDGPIWLSDPVFGCIRVKLRYRANPLPTYLEFSGMENDLAKVRDGMQRKLVPLSSLQAITPTCKDDIVTSFSLGDTYGKLYKIRSYDSNCCVLRGFGQRTGRNEKNVLVNTRELAEVFPPLK